MYEKYSYMIILLPLTPSETLLFPLNLQHFPLIIIVIYITYTYKYTNTSCWVHLVLPLCTCFTQFPNFAINSKSEWRSPRKKFSTGDIQNEVVCSDSVLLLFWVYFSPIQMPPIFSSKYVFLVVDFVSLCHYLLFSFYSPTGFDTIMWNKESCMLKESQHCKEWTVSDFRKYTTKKPFHCCHIDTACTIYMTFYEDKLYINYSWLSISGSLPWSAASYTLPSTLSIISLLIRLSDSPIVMKASDEMHLSICAQSPLRRTSLLSGFSILRYQIYCVILLLFFNI